MYKKIKKIINYISYGVLAVFIIMLIFNNYKWAIISLAVLMGLGNLSMATDIAELKNQ